MISANHVLQIGSKGKSGIIDSTMFDKLVTEDTFNEFLEINKHPKIPRSDNSMHDHREDSANWAKGSPKPEFVKQPAVISK